MQLCQLSKTLSYRRGPASTALCSSGQADVYLFLSRFQIPLRCLRRCADGAEGNRRNVADDGWRQANIILLLLFFFLRTRVRGPVVQA